MRESYLDTDARERTDNYAMVCEKWRKIFLAMDMEDLVRRFHLETDEDALYITFFCERYRLDRRTGMVTSTDDPEERLRFNTLMCIYHLFHYSRPGAEINGTFVPFRQVKNASPFDPAFQRTVLKPLAETFSGHPDLLEQACRELDGQPVRQGDVGSVINAFDCIPLTVLFWDGDDEFDAQANILFDTDITDFIHEETVVCLASELAARLIRRSGLTLKGILVGQDY